MGKKYGMIDKEGKIIVNPQFDEIVGFYNYISDVSSDFFDASELTNLLLKGTDQNNFRGINKTTALKQLTDDVHKGSEIKEYGDDGILVNDSIWIDESAEITSLKYSFSSKIYTYKTTQSFSYYYGSYDSGLKKNYNWEAAVNGIVLKIGLVGNAAGKEDRICKAIGEQLAKLLNTKSSIEDDNIVIISTTMKVIIKKSLPTYYGTEIEFDVEFY